MGIWINDEPHKFKLFSYYMENGRQFVDLTNPTFMA